MRDIRFYHCADIHLDTPFASLGDKPGLPGRRRRGLLEAFSKMMESVKVDKPDLLLISGDLFENDYSRLGTISEVNRLFSLVHDTKVLMISGNHDPEAANSFYKTYKWNSNVFFLGEEQNEIYFEELATVVHGIGFGAGFGYSSILNSIEPDISCYNILLFHGDIDLQIGNRDYNSVSSSIIESKGFDYTATGHNHKRRIYGTNIYNPGSLDPLGFDEPGNHGYFKGTLSKGSDPMVEFVENSEIEYITLEVDITGITSDDDLIKILQNKTDDEGHLYKIVLKGSKTLEYSPDINMITGRLLERTMYSKLRDESTVRISVEELSMLKGLKGEFARTVLERIESATEDEKEILMKALYYGIEAIDTGSIDKAGGIEF